MSTLITYFWKTFQQTWNIVKKAKATMALIALSDLIFFLLFSFISMFFMQKMLTDLYAIGSLFEGNIPQDETALATYLGALPEGTFQTHYLGFLKLLLAVCVISFVLWLIFQGFVWKKSFRLVKKAKSKQSWPDFCKNFTVLHLFWCLIVLIVYYIFTELSLRNMLGNVALFTDQQLLWMLVVVLFVYGYFYVVSLLLLEKYKNLELFKMTFVEGIKKIKFLGFLYAGMLLDIGITGWIFYKLSAYYFLTAAWVAILFYICYFAFIRVFLIKSYEGLGK